MRLVRSILTASLLLVGCAPAVDEACLAPRAGDEEVCDTLPGSSWRFVVGEEAPDFQPYCKATCLDLKGRVAIGGYDDLRKVPLLQKLRQVQTISISIDGLRDLRGLEHVDVEYVDLRGSYREDSRTFSSLEGLGDRDLESLTLAALPSLTSIAAPGFSRLGSLDIVESGVTELDISQIVLRYLTVDLNNRLARITLGTGTMDTVRIEASDALESLAWQPGLKVTHTIVVTNNPRLSSCVVADFASQVDPERRATLSSLRNNGPCP